MTDQTETTAITSETVATVVVTPANPKKRGRPKGSTNKKKAKTTATPKKTAAKKPAANPKPTPPPAETPATLGPGRPPGSTNEKQPEVVGTLTRCPHCKSTKREPYFGINTMEYTGTDPNGDPYNRITWKRTKCKSCQRARIDKFFELIPDA